MTTHTAREPSHQATPPRAKRAAKAASSTSARQPRAPAWTCPRCGTRKRLRGDRQG